LPCVGRYAIIGDQFKRVVSWLAEVIVFALAKKPTKSLKRTAFGCRLAPTLDIGQRPTEHTVSEQLRSLELALSVEFEAGRVPHGLSVRWRPARRLSEFTVSYAVSGTLADRRQEAVSGALGSLHRTVHQHRGGYGPCFRGTASACRMAKFKGGFVQPRASANVRGHVVRALSNPSIERRSTGKPVAPAHVKR
jgi:hypothetical protein